MTKEQREFHQRMNEAIKNAIDDLCHEFDIEKRDFELINGDLVACVRSDLKDLLLKAYARNHSWIGA